MPAFDPNQLGGPSAVTMGSLMGNGPASRAAFQVPGVPPMTGPPMQGGPGPGMPQGMPPGGMPPGLPMPGGPGGGPPMPPPGAGMPPPPGMGGGPGMPPQGMGSPPGPPQGPPDGGPPSGPPGTSPVAAVQDAADDAAIHAALATTKNDPDEAAKVLARSGHQSASQKLQQAARMHRQQELRKRSDLVSDQQAQFRVGKKLLSAVDDDASLRVVKGMLGPVGQQIGDTFQEAGPRIQQILQSTVPTEKILDHQQLALQAMQTALRTGDQREWVRAAALVLSTATEPGEWQSLIGQLKQAGAPSEVLNQFDTVYSDRAVMEAKQLAARDGKHETPGGGFEDMGLLAALR